MLPKISIIKRDSSLVNINDIIPQQLKKISLKSEDVDITYLQNEWSTIVGENIGAVSNPQKIVGTKLRIKTSSGAWKMELTYHKKELLKRIQEHVGAEKIRDISFM